MILVSPEPADTDSFPQMPPPPPQPALYTCQTHAHLKAHYRVRDGSWWQDSGQDVSGCKQTEPAETTDGPWQWSEKENVSPFQLQLSQDLLAHLSSILPGLPFLLPTQGQMSYPARAAAALALTEWWWRRRDHRDFAAKEKQKKKNGLELLMLLVYMSTNVRVYHSSS